MFRLRGTWYWQLRQTKIVCYWQLVAVAADSKLTKVKMPSGHDSSWGLRWNAVGNANFVRKNMQTEYYKDGDEK